MADDEGICWEPSSTEKKKKMPDHLPRIGRCGRRTGKLRGELRVLPSCHRPCFTCALPCVRAKTSKGKSDFVDVRRGVAEIGSQRRASLSRPPQPQPVRHEQEEKETKSECGLWRVIDRSNIIRADGLIYTIKEQKLHDQGQFI